MKYNILDRVYSLMYAVIFLFVIILAVIICINAMANSVVDLNQYCDNKYGKDNWIMNDITGNWSKEFYKPFLNKLYIGQVWECENITCFMNDVQIDCSDFPTSYKYTGFCSNGICKVNGVCPTPYNNKSVEDCINEAIERQR